MLIEVLTGSFGKFAACYGAFNTFLEIIKAQSERCWNGSSFKDSSSGGHLPLQEIGLPFDCSRLFDSHLFASKPPCRVCFFTHLPTSPSLSIPYAPTTHATGHARAVRGAR